MKLNFETLIIFVQNVDQLKPFYVDILKLGIVEEIKSEWLLLEAGHCKIGLHKIGDQYLEAGAAAFKFDNNTKVVFEVEEDIHQIREYLLREKVLMKEIKTFDNYDYLLCDGEDPEGNVFQIKQRKK
ncbi:lactoylglutathione lyase [Pedobacter sp. KBW06]|uniref:VOC family protein n=1 Tax=Pedobacter sp. KBW06 TaxID=2153359 RepID=UPI000F58FAE0|nr:VOC family protein [Pedobacter sp. KBW06]RQO70076.1 lactoylglutathione lyase [Pedobacter sp. KBW06]